MPYALFPTEFGQCGLAWNDAGLTAFVLAKATAKNFRAEGEDVSEAPPKWVRTLIKRVQKHLSGPSEDFADLTFDWSRVTSFQGSVYRQALSVPPGETQTYGWLAEAMGRPTGSSRAVGGALSKNPWILLVPCHRFIGANGKLTGFSAAGGLVTKRKLLDLERCESLAE